MSLLCGCTFSTQTINVDLRISLFRIRVFFLQFIQLFGLCTTFKNIVLLFSLFYSQINLENKLYTKWASHIWWPETSMVHGMESIVVVSCRCWWVIRLITSTSTIQRPKRWNVKSIIFVLCFCLKLHDLQATWLELEQAAFFSLCSYEKSHLYHHSWPWKSNP